MAQINRKYKDRVFRKLFGEGEKENLLSLYNALNESNYDNIDDLEITTIEDVIYMGMKNDVSFIIDDTLTLIEHQSTFSPNLPLRGLLYFSRIYEAQLGDDMQAVFSPFKFQIPFPKYFVLYNGEKKLPEKMDLKLSDLFEYNKAVEGDLECVAHIININDGSNKKILNACKTLGDYAKLIGEIRKRKENSRITEKSIQGAVDYCIENDILTKFLVKHKREVIGMFLTEFDQNKYERVVGKLYKEEGFKEGEKSGTNKTLINLVQKGIITKAQALEQTDSKKELEELFVNKN